MEQLELNDIDDDLIVINKTTIEKLCQLESAFDCLALYVFYYKTAKWQKTNSIKANDSYVMKSLKIGKAKLTKTKQILIENGLIEVIQNRENGKITGWFIKIHYLVPETIYNSQTPLVEISTCEEQDTNALRIYNKCLKNINNNIIAQKEPKPIKKQTKTLNEELFEKFWNAYPKKKSKGDAEKWFSKNKPSEELVSLMVDKISKLKETKDWKKDNGQYIPYPTTWLNAKGWEDEVNVDKKKDDSFPYELYKQYYGPQGEYYYDEDYKRIFGRVPRNAKY